MKASGHFLQRLFSPKHSLVIFLISLGLVYGIVPWLVFEFFVDDFSFIFLPILTVISLAGLLVGGRVSIFDDRFSGNEHRLLISSNVFHGFTWAFFAIFIIITFITAPSIPLISAMRGVTSDFLALERGDFLKTRAGAEIALLYISTFLVNTIVPYSTVMLYASASKYRHLCAAVFFMFCISFLQKSLFLNLVLPLLAYYSVAGSLPKKTAIIGISASIALLIGSTYVTVGNGVNTLSEAGGFDAIEYMASTYIAPTPIHFFMWRSLAVPVFTATDTIFVHADQFGGRLLLGATSSLLAAMFGLERINLERIVFEHQFGGWSDIANSNAVFIVDAYVNFGFAGVLIFSLIIGQVFRWFRISSDVAFQSLWPLFAFVLFSASFIGMLFSNGFLYMLLHAAFVKIKPSSHYEKN